MTVPPARQAVIAAAEPHLSRTGGGRNTPLQLPRLNLSSPVSIGSDRSAESEARSDYSFRCTSRASFVMCGMVTVVVGVIAGAIAAAVSETPLTGLIWGIGLGLGLGVSTGLVLMVGCMLVMQKLVLGL